MEQVITYQDFLSTHKSNNVMTEPETMYRNLIVNGESLKNPNAVTLGQLQNIITEDSHPTTTNDQTGMKNRFSVCYAKACVDSICRAYKRVDPMSDEDKMQTAVQIVLSYPYITIYQLKDFEIKLTSGFVPLHSPSGDDYEMKAVDRGSIMARLRAYNTLYCKKAYAFEEPAEPTRIDSAFPLGARDRRERTHDAYGNEMPVGWDYNRYWQDWRIEHNYNLVKHQWEDAPERTLQQAIAYWNRPISMEERHAVCDRQISIFKSPY